ncbi:MAG TPA: 50S ribosomal protein L13 [Anaerolineae bacterium]|nr:50S ribosomal protein L13 [Anaerolineae bacterium]
MKTYNVTKEEIQREWVLVDAEGQTLGRLASRIAAILRGKHKPTFAPWLDCGDYVIVVNAGKIKVTGNRMDSKVYYRHSGYVGGLKSVTLRRQLEKHPERVLAAAVRGMLPNNRLGRKMVKKLKLYTGSDHPHAAQQPKKLEL